MTQSSSQAWADALPEISDKELKTIVRLVYEKSGITLHSGKKALVTARLQKRVKQGGFASFQKYLDHVQRDTTGDELTALLDAIATNHTSFFREPQHFALRQCLARFGLGSGLIVSPNSQEEG